MYQLQAELQGTQITFQILNESVHAYLDGSWAKARKLLEGNTFHSVVDPWVLELRKMIDDAESRRMAKPASYPCCRCCQHKLLAAQLRESEASSASDINALLLEQKEAEESVARRQQGMRGSRAYSQNISING